MFHVYPAFFDFPTRLIARFRPRLGILRHLHELKHKQANIKQASKHLYTSNLWSLYWFLMISLCFFHFCTQRSTENWFLSVMCPNYHIRRICPGKRRNEVSCSLFSLQYNFLVFISNLDFLIFVLNRKALRNRFLSAICQITIDSAANPYCKTKKWGRLLTLLSVIFLSVIYNAFNSIANTRISLLFSAPISESFCECLPWSKISRPPSLKPEKKEREGS